MMKRTFMPLPLAAALAVAGSAIPQMALAQQQETGAIEEVVITARRRDESLQDVPIAVTAISGKQLAETLAFDTQSLTALSSSLVISTGQSETQGAQIRIRGIGTASGNVSFEGAVGVYVNGVYVPRSGIALNELVDVSQVQVLRGPQGTLFGKNTSAGAVLLETARPESEFSASATAEVGTIGDSDFGEMQRFSGYVTGPLGGDSVSGRLAFSAQDREGYVENIVDGSRLNNRDRFLVRGSVLFEELAERGQLFLAVDYSEKNEDCCAAVPFINGPTTGIISALGGAVADAPTFNRVARDSPTTADTEEIGLQAVFDYEFDAANLKAIVGYRDFAFDRVQDVDGSSLDIFRGPSFEIDSTFLSGELLLTGTVDDRWDWLVGGYLFQDEITDARDQRFGVDTGPYSGILIPPLAGLLATAYPTGQGEQVEFTQDTDGWSLFTHHTFRVTDMLELSGGLRYLEESKDGGGRIVGTPRAFCETGLPQSLKFSCPVNDFDTSFDDEEVVGTLAGRLLLTDSVSAYVSYANGFKSGGISFDRLAGGPVPPGGQKAVVEGTTFNPEKVQSVELGLKSEFFDRRLVVNAALFRQDLEDFQVNVFDGVNFLIGNLGDVENRGGELEVSLTPVDGLTANFGVTYAETEEDGVQIPFAPEWVATGAISYRRAMSDSVDLVVNANARYMDDQVLGGDNDPIKTQEAYTLVNGRIGLDFKRYGLQASLFGRNVFDEEYALVITNAVFQGGSFNQFPGEPSIYGIQVTKDF